MQPYSRAFVQKIQARPLLAETEIDSLHKNYASIQNNSLNFAKRDLFALNHILARYRQVSDKKTSGHNILKKKLSEANKEGFVFDLEDIESVIEAIISKAKIYLKTNEVQSFKKELDKASKIFEKYPPGIGLVQNSLFDRTNLKKQTLEKDSVPTIGEIYKNIERLNTTSPLEVILEYASKQDSMVSNLVELRKLLTASSPLNRNELKEALLELLIDIEITREAYEKVKINDEYQDEKNQQRLQACIGQFLSALEINFLYGFIEYQSTSEHLQMKREINSSFLELLENKKKVSDNEALAHLRYSIDLSNKKYRAYRPLFSISEQDDVIQAGFVGLMTAIRSYRGKDSKLTTYSWGAINGESVDEIVDNEGFMRISLPQKKHLKKVYREAQRIIHAGEVVYKNRNQDRFYRDIAQKIKNNKKALGFSADKEQVQQALFWFSRSRIADSLESWVPVERDKAHDTDEENLADGSIKWNRLRDTLTQKSSLEESGVEDILQRDSDESLKERVQAVLKTLSYREREIISLRYGLSDGYSYTLEEVGHIFKTTRERIRQIEAKAIRKLQQPSRAQELVEFL